MIISQWTLPLHFHLVQCVCQVGLSDMKHTETHKRNTKKGHTCLLWKGQERLGNKHAGRHTQGTQEKCFKSSKQVLVPLGASTSKGLKRGPRLHPNTAGQAFSRPATYAPAPTSRWPHHWAGGPHYVQHQRISTTWCGEACSYSNSSRLNPVTICCCCPTAHHRAAACTTAAT